jgi:hypothetical protein
VSHKNARDLANFQIATQNLMLRALTAVKQPSLCPLRQPQGNTRDITGTGWHTRTGSKKGNLQSQVSRVDGSSIGSRFTYLY